MKGYMFHRCRKESNALVNRVTRSIVICGDCRVELYISVNYFVEYRSIR